MYYFWYIKVKMFNAEGEFTNYVFLRYGALGSKEVWLLVLSHTREKLKLAKKTFVSVLPEPPLLLVISTSLMTPYPWTATHSLESITRHNASLILPFADSISCLNSGSKRSLLKEWLLGKCYDGLSNLGSSCDVRLLNSIFLKLQISREFLILAKEISW